MIINRQMILKNLLLLEFPFYLITKNTHASHRSQQPAKTRSQSVYLLVPPPPVPLFRSVRVYIYDLRHIEPDSQSQHNVEYWAIWETPALGPRKHSIH